MNDSIMSILRNLLFIAPLFYSLTSLGEVKVGDKATLQIRFNTDDSTSNSFKQLEVTEVNNSNGTFKYNETYTSSGRIIYEIPHTGRLLDVLNEEANYTKCESSKIGKFETITVPAGTFITCHVTFRALPSMDPDELYYANVPFALVRKNTLLSSASGIEMIEELVSYIKK